MPPLPWKSFAAPSRDRDSVALLSFLPLKSYWMIPKFLWLTLAIQRQLSKSKGLIGYSLLAEPLRRRFWTLSAWRDRQSLMDFVGQIPHSRIMRVLAPYMDKTKFVQWDVPANDIPLRWDDAKSRISRSR